MRPRHLLLVGLTGILSLLLGGCASPASSAAMATTSTATVKKLADAVSVTVSGGSETSTMGASQISGADFARAIKDSIVKSGLFARLVDRDQADCLVDAQIVRLDQPAFGFSMTVTLEVNWRLVRRSDQKVLWEKALTSIYTAGAGEAFAGVTRLRLATEGAARNNIQDAINRMSRVSLD